MIQSPITKHNTNTLSLVLPLKGEGRGRGVIARNRVTKQSDSEVVILRAMPEGSQ
jgi:hypothetical protein